MANIKVSELSQASTLNDNDLLMIVQNNENKKISFDNFNKILNGVKLKSEGGISSATITSLSGYGCVFIISSQFACILQLSSTSVIIHDIYGTHGNMQASISNNVVSITELYDWDHYIFIGSSAINNIELI